MAHLLAAPDFHNPVFLWKAGGAGAILLLGFILVAIINRLTTRFVGPRLSTQGIMVLRKLIRYLGVAFVCIIALNQVGLNLGAILGAAGVMGIAIGFAAQTSLSNIISGFFLIGERPFELGDVIEVEGISGTVDTIGLLSLTLRTFDNRSVRIPNETLVKTKVINVTRHPIRRFSLEIGVAYDENIGHVLGVLKDISEKNVQCLDEPSPLIVFTGFGDSSLNFVLGAWCLQEDYGTLRNSLPRELKERFDREQIEIPFPHMTLATGKALGPIPVKMVGNEQ
ncbi:MAG: mechanosensitive ion channel family protein [Roseibacillus sp.]